MRDSSTSNNFELKSLINHISNCFDTFQSLVYFQDILTLFMDYKNTEFINQIIHARIFIFLKDSPLQPLSSPFYLIPVSFKSSCSTMIIFSFKVNAIIRKTRNKELIQNKYYLILLKRSWFVFHVKNANNLVIEHFIFNDVLSLLLSVQIQFVKIIIQKYFPTCSSSVGLPSAVLVYLASWRIVSLLLEYHLPSEVKSSLVHRM